MHFSFWLIYSALYTLDFTHAQEFDKVTWAFFWGFAFLLAPYFSVQPDFDELALLLPIAHKV